MILSSAHLSRQLQIALFSSILLTTALLVHWTFTSDPPARTGHVGHTGATGLGLLPSRWTIWGGRVKGGPGGVWGIDRGTFMAMAVMTDDVGGTSTETDGEGTGGVDGEGGESGQGGQTEEKGAEGGLQSNRLIAMSEGGRGGQQVVLDTHQILDRTKGVWRKCMGGDEFEDWFGRTNLRMSRAYEGSHFKLRRFAEKLLRGEKVTVSVIGGSITKGHHVEKDEIWFTKFTEFVDDFFDAHGRVEYVNGAKPAVGSDYFSFCFPLHIPPTSDLVLVELAVNDEGIPEHADNMENLLRGLLAMDNAPGVVLVEAMAFSNGGMGGGGGRMHLPVAQYYDVPVINHRHTMANHLARYPELVTHYFAHEPWGVDTRHISQIGHLDLARLVSSLLRDATCTMLGEEDYILPARSIPPLVPLREDVYTEDGEPGSSLPPHPAPGLPKPDDGDWEPLSDHAYWSAQRQLDKTLSSIRSSQSSHSWPVGALSWQLSPSSEYPPGRIMPPLENTPPEMGLMPRMPVLAGWNPNLDHSLPPFRPMCLSTDAHEPRYNMTPTKSEGWEYWIHPDHLDKPYLRATQQGAWAEFEFETSLGVVKVYSLKSRTFGLGDVECWVDGEREKGVRVEGYWDKSENMGRNVVIRNDLKPGRHTIRCELLEETHDPEGGTEFRMISLMSL